MKLPALLAASAAVLIAVPAHGQVRMRITQADREVLDFRRCNIRLININPLSVFSKMPCTKLEISNTGRSVNIHFTTGVGTSTFVIDNREQPDDDDHYSITSSAFTPRGEGPTPRPLKYGQGGFCSLSTTRLKCSHLIDGRVISGEAALE
ncbi:hypothetical protein H6G65_15440 [Microcystis elabens FACHB-917]|nr:hypothetical protein [Microcystis elabens FACHB-917]